MELINKVNIIVTWNKIASSIIIQDFKREINVKIRQLPYINKFMMQRKSNVSVASTSFELCLLCERRLWFLCKIYNLQEIIETTTKSTIVWRKNANIGTVMLCSTPEKVDASITQIKPVNLLSLDFMLFPKMIFVEEKIKGKLRTMSNQIVNFLVKIDFARNGKQTAINLSILRLTSV